MYDSSGTLFPLPNIFKQEATGSRPAPAEREEAVNYHVANSKISSWKTSISIVEEGTERKEKRIIMSTVSTGGGVKSSFSLARVLSQWQRG